ncbi:alkanesulfonate monooxygenase SsuD/methylene tetrahydromethanopterin reductase-like flavin-dependent oxidoreductase (luciferase family) [Allocatelliglobosispora scoriae]|uniref:Alkanesulfonate monooxygenase SsuD/methylene tetrahydromethanopterin reductase-like flavin-dependent oxidoreductase (Luciferase family) n=1 Tax=Allocatelliglobosispora scoriae TaxID=643052 RepID=A0A841C5B4_9ACTN|nr:MsnO8 family LLM class oxidoreductase [Allocatelliglobosispora scoriae]MBB5874140.1 alkanesulfonate monooxygenase SsuD/methylene tetrahydromethanopterin reductase-like flavin-dependent oxidoreductase (luciferase family) [Allocatelliglobosispora scoriae]
MTVPLCILDLSPVPAGGGVAAALRNSVDLARRAEEFGYHRYWVAEHHFAAGVASSHPALLIAQIAAATSHIRVGSGAVQTGHQTALSIAEQFGLLDALYPGRIDLGLGRSGQRRVEAIAELGRPPVAPPEARVVDGLLIPRPFSFAKLIGSPRFAVYASLLQQEGALPPDFPAQVDEILALLAAEYRSEDGVEAYARAGEATDVEVWVLGSSGGESARVAGARGLPFAANYHVSPATVLEAAEGYRAAFQPSAGNAAPRMMVSADVVVASDDEEARRLATPYALWVRSIRLGEGAIPYPTPEQAAAYAWSDEDRELVADRLATQFVGSPQTVAEQLRTLQRVTGADEVLVTTITHDHADRVHSFELLAKEWYA